MVPQGSAHHSPLAHPLLEVLCLAVHLHSVLLLHLEVLQHLVAPLKEAWAPVHQEGKCQTILVFIERRGARTSLFFVHLPFHLVDQHLFFLIRMLNKLAAVVGACSITRLNCTAAVHVCEEKPLLWYTVNIKKCN